MSSSVRVIKFGGSLLAWPGAVAGFRRWLALQRPAANVVVVGGGGLVDALREIDRQRPVAPEVSHRLAIQAMSLTAELVVEQMSEATKVSKLEQLRLTPRAVQILEVEHFLREDSQSHDALPAGWDVTSDSIAARVTKVLHAAELVLLKSTLPVCSASLEAWSRSGFVDAYFARAAAGLCVHAVNLRADEFPHVAVE